jgi:hypothetical protein
MANKNKYLTYVLIAAVPISFGVYLIIKNAAKKRSSSTSTTPPTKPSNNIIDKIKNWWDNIDLRTF